MNDLFFDYAMLAALFCALGLVIYAAFKVGHEFGYRDGWRDGLARGRLFGRLKLHENRFPNRDN